MSLLTSIRKWIDPNYTPTKGPVVPSERSRVVAQRAVKYIRPRMGRRAFTEAIAKAEKETREGK